jgi:methionine--tRNA ligase/methionine--tRNA ligase beta chain
MNDPKRYLITAALPYANGPVHIGHLAGCYLPADIYVRYLRAQKRDVKFIGGSDEHGVPITIRALKEGIKPQEVVDRYHAIIKESMQQMGISFDIYSRTSNKVHHETAAAFFKKMYDEGLFEEKETEQYYDEQTKTFLADRYITGTCPVCANPNAYGDQCERCGSALSPEQLINPKSTLSDAVPVKKKTKHWYFPLQNYESWLKEWILEGHKEWKNNVYGQCKSWLDSGLQSRAMTRDSNWGIKVPLPDADGKVLYVWFDAPIGYISATKELTEQWADYWCKEDTKLVHFIGKDNIVFHCIIFPAMLKAHGGFVLPENVPANEFLNIEGEKVSTSRNWAVWVHEYIKDFPGCEDVLRYVLCANAPETKDNDFTWKDFQDRNNSELASIFGNFVNRTWVLMHKLCNGKVPKLHADILDEKDKALIKEIENSKLKVENFLEEFKFRDALFEVIDLSRKGNKYMQEKEPWIKAKKASLNPSEGGTSDSDEGNSSHSYQTADPMIYGLLKNYVAEHRANPTPAEELLWEIVRGKKLDSYKFRRQHIIGSSIADFVCIRQKLIIEVDGLIHQVPENIMSDEARTAELNRLGFDVIRFTNDEVLSNTDYVLNSILSKLTEKSQTESGIKNPPSEGREAQKSIDNCLHLCLQLTANLTILINPFLPTIAAKLLTMMKVVDKMLDWENAGKVKLLSVGYSLREPQILFRKIEDEEISKQIEKLKTGLASPNPCKGGALNPANYNDISKLSEVKNPPLEGREAITFDDFAKIDLKVGSILSAEKVEKADKLLKLQIDLGFETRTIVSGIAMHFQPQDIVGKQVVVVANLAPRKMRGIESNGMILMAEDKAGKLHFVKPETVIDNGSGVS